VNQDVLGRQGRRVQVNGDRQVWMRDLASGDVAVVLYNVGSGQAALAFTLGLSDVGFSSSTVVLVRDLFARQNVGTFVGTYTSPPVPPNGVQMLRLSIPSPPY
jgi:alpha-galactosidase